MDPKKQPMVRPNEIRPGLPPIRPHMVRPPMVRPYVVDEPPANTLSSDQDQATVEPEVDHVGDDHHVTSDEPKKVEDVLNDIEDLPLYKAALHGDWMTAKKIFEENPHALTTKMSHLKETALHVAVRAGSAIHFVENLVNMMPKDSLLLTNRMGGTPLHEAAIAGNARAARILVENNSMLPQIKNNYNDTPLHTAAVYAHKDTIQYLLTVTRDEDPSPFTGKFGGKLLVLLIIGDLYGIALDLLHQYPTLAVEEDYNGNTALIALARKPHVFLSGSRLRYYQRVLYFFCPVSVDRKSGLNQTKDVENQVDDAWMNRCTKEFKRFRFLQHIHDTKLMHMQTLKLLRILISEILKSTPPKARKLFGPATGIAARFGIHEFVSEIISTFPHSLWAVNADKHNFFHLAIMFRQEKVFNIIHQLSSQKHLIMASPDKFGNNMLHLAAKLGPLNKIAGAALQMQRELQWFKEVEKYVQPSYKDKVNKNGKTPSMLFTEEHKDLVKEGEKWMKDTSTSCTVVAALVVTVVFAAAFTVPGGNTNDTGIPIYINDPAFMVFAISNALALFSSSTSLLMFLGILTSRYSEEDFLMALPMRLGIGLVMLFFSIASMLVAFGAAFHIVLSHKVHWIAAPIGLLACIPVTLFALLQFSLQVEIVHSTFGPSIFHKQSDDIIC